MLKALDLYSGAVGDRFICAHVLSLTAEFIASFDFIWSSPPCQFHSATRNPT
jgi:hypothetical protein